MSLIAQMVASNDSNNHDDTVEHSELPLFAAADQLSKTRARNKKIVIGAALLTALGGSYWVLNVNQQLFSGIDSLQANPVDTVPVVEGQIAESFNASAAEPEQVSKTKPEPVAKSLDIQTAPSSTVSDNVKPADVAKADTVNPVTHKVKTKDPATDEADHISTHKPVVEKKVEKAEHAVAKSQPVKRKPLESANTQQAQAVNVKTSRIAPLEVQDKRLQAKAKQLIQERRQAAAITLLNNELRNAALPKSTELLVGLLIAEGRLAEAQVRIAKYRENFSQSLAIEKQALQLAVQQGNYDAVLQTVARLAVAIEKDPAFNEFKAAALQAKGDYAQAAEAYQQLIQFDARRSKWWIGLAINLDAMANFAQAKQAYQQALINNDLNGELSLYANQRLAQL